jgi:deoxyribonuclease-4
MSFIGIHIKTKKVENIKESFVYAHKIGCSYVQLFNENIDKEIKLKKLLKKLKLKMIIHAPYIINIGAEFNPHSWRTKYLLMEIENAFNNGAIGIVVHLGKSVNESMEDATNNMYQLLNYIVHKFHKQFYIYLKTTAGQGTELCWKIEDLAEFYSRIKKNPLMKNIKICLDTCHLFAAGYDIRTPNKVDIFLKDFDKLIGCKHVGLIHLNDSINDIGTHKDRHTNIGKGFIGLHGLKYFYNFFARRNIPSILETPVENYEDEIKSVINKN